MKNGKKGFTLVELAVTIALIGIVGTLVISFSILMSNRVATTKRQNQVIEDVSNIETEIKNWLRRYDNSDYYFVIDNENTVLKVMDTKGTIGDKNDDVLKNALTLKGEDGIYEGNPANAASQKRLSKTQYVKSLKFGITSEKSSKGNSIIYCDAVYIDASVKSHDDRNIRFMFSTFAQSF